MNCNELVEVITDYVEGLLPPGDTQRLEAHLAECPGCRTYLEQMQGVIQTLGKLEESDLSPEARNKLLQVFHDWRKDV